MFDFFIDFFNQFSQNEWMGNTIQQYVHSLMIFIITYLLLLVIKNILILSFYAQREKSDSRIYDILIEFLESLNFLFYFVVSLYTAFDNINTPTWFNNLLSSLVILVTVLYVFLHLQKILVLALYKVSENQLKEEKHRLSKSQIDTISFAVKTLVWVVALITILQNFNINVTAIIGGLGISGIALAFALQNVLSDIFASFSIYLDRPFMVEDFVIIGADSGVVKKIGIKSTRIKTLEGEELIISNKELTNTRIRNLSRLKKRRTHFTIYVEANTQNDQLKLIPTFFRKIVDNLEICEYDRCHLKNISGKGMEFEMVYFVNSSDYDTYMDVQQKILLEVKEYLKQANIMMLNTA